MTIKQQRIITRKLQSAVQSYKLTWGKCDGKTTRKLYREIARRVL